MNIKQLKEYIKDIPDEADILIANKHGFSRLAHTKKESNSIIFF